MVVEHYQHFDARNYYKKDHMTEWTSFFDKHIPYGAEVLNVGCGRAASLRMFGRHNWQGVDFNPKLSLIWGELMIADRCVIGDVSAMYWLNRNDFEYVVSCDFMEHVQPEFVDDVLIECARVAPVQIHVVHCEPNSMYRGPNGENLHVSANTPPWWDDKFKQHGVEHYHLIGSTACRPQR